MSVMQVIAIFENGVLKPLEPLELENHQRVHLSIDTATDAVVDSAEDELRAWQTVFDGLSDQEVDAIEEIALDRDDFMRRAS